MSDYMNEINIWIPVFASATSWVGQYYVLSEHPDIICEQGVNVLSEIIEDYSKDTQFVVANLLKKCHSLLEDCIKKGVDEVYNVELSYEVSPG